MVPTPSFEGAGDHKVTLVGAAIIHEGRVVGLLAQPFPRSLQGQLAKLNVATSVFSWSPHGL